jgi:GT2 family glycosyltransferase
MNQPNLQLSVIILNYNVKYFLEQALLSVRKAIEGLAAEIIVVDNNSVDGSVAMVREKFPQVIVIANQHNPGFAAGNNQGIRIAKGKYVLILNPDTVTEEATLRKCVAFMDATPDAGALGVQMYDGKGNFLPESKRGLPMPMVAFYKMIGLSQLFPHSRRFNYYYMGHLPNNETHAVEVLSGAFMLVRRETLDKVGLLDEAFFMYGEDIDWSYRILQAGYKNYYLASARIIHYKGESTKRGSLNYVKMFYQAMLIFAKKHFSAQDARLYVWGISIAIYIKATLTVLQNFLRRALLPLCDVALWYMALWWLKNFWEQNLKSAERLTYPPEYLSINAPIYVAIWCLSAYLNGGYDPPQRLSHLVRGLLIGTLLISAVYGFLPEHLRFSRGMILAGMVLAIAISTVVRLLLHFVRHKNFALDEQPKRRTIIVGDYEECERVRSLLLQSTATLDLIGYVAIEPQQNLQQFLGNSHQLKEIAEIYHLNEIIFCAKNISSQEIIQFMIDIGQQLDYKIVPQDSWSIIGSNSKYTAGDLYTIDIHLNLNEQRHRRNKRLLDVLVATVLLVLFPFALLLIPHRTQFLNNWWQVLLGKKTWVGYAPSTAPTQQKPLPRLPKGVLSFVHQLPQRSYDVLTLQRLNFLYAKDYSMSTDIAILGSAWRNLGNH